ncbi:MAG: bacillithiol system redox-active protein YtxJ [Bacteroidota bacterium]
MGWFSSKNSDSVPKKETPLATVHWKSLSSLDQLSEILDDRSSQKHVLFKHSTRCGVSAMTKRQFEKEWPADKDEINIWYLDLLKYRDISNAIAEKTGVFHQSPQAIALLNGEVRYDASHSEVSARRIIKSLEQ